MLKIVSVEEKIKQMCDPYKGAKVPGAVVAIVRKTGPVAQDYIL